MNQRIRTILLIAAATALFFLIIFLNLRRSPPAEKVTTEKVKYGSLVSRVSATGTLKAQAQVNLQAQVMGTVDQLLVQEGDWVNKNDLLLKLDQKSYQAQLVQTRSRFEQALASFNRVESLYAKQLVSTEQYEAAKTAYEAAQAQYDQAKDQLDKTVLRAPISGTVVKLNVKEGETVILGTMNNPGTVVMVLADMSRMEAWVNVDETDIVSLAAGQKACVKVDALPEKSFPGTVTRIGYMPTQTLLSTDATGTEFEVVISLDSSAAVLRPGMSVSADITTASLDSVLVIPLQAVGRRQLEGKEQETVFLVQNGKAMLRSVRTGRSSDTEVQILEGLEEGDVVITGPYKVLSRLREGTRVK